MKQINKTQPVTFDIIRNNKKFVVTGDYESVSTIYERTNLPTARKQPTRTTQSLSKALNVPKLAIGGLKQELRTQAKIVVFDMVHNTHYLQDYKLAKRAEKMKTFEKEVGLSYK